jgi:hypothetical protein
MSQEDSQNSKPRLGRILVKKQGEEVRPVDRMPSVLGLVHRGMAILGREMDRLNIESAQGQGLHPKQTEQLVSYIKIIRELQRAEKEAVAEEADDLSKYSFEQLLEMAKTVSKDKKEKSDEGT